MPRHRTNRQSRFLHPYESLHYAIQGEICRRLQDFAQSLTADFDIGRGTIGDLPRVAHRTQPRLF